MFIHFIVNIIESKGKWKEPDAKNSMKFRRLLYNFAQFTPTNSQLHYIVFSFYILHRLLYFTTTLLSPMIESGELRSVLICRKYTFNLVARRIDIKCVWLTSFHRSIFYTFIRSNLHANCVQHKDLGMNGWIKKPKQKWRTTESVTCCICAHSESDYNLTSNFFFFLKKKRNYYEPISLFTFDFCSVLFAGILVQIVWKVYFALSL